MYRNRTYEAGTLAVISRFLKLGDTFVDVGANLGLMTLHASRIVGPEGKVVAFEPHPETYRRLIQNIELNNCSNVQPLQMAAGSGKSEAQIYDVPSVNIGRASLIRPDVDYRPAGQVKVSTLDEELDGQRVQFLKIDVEGFEAEVLAGASETLAKRPIISMEVSTAVCVDHMIAHDMVMDTGLTGPSASPKARSVHQSFSKLAETNCCPNSMTMSSIYLHSQLTTGLPLPRLARTKPLGSNNFELRALQALFGPTAPPQTPAFLRVGTAPAPVHHLVSLIGRYRMLCQPKFSAEQLRHSLTQ